MGRKAQNRIKVTLQLEEGNYQSLAVNAHNKGLTVTEYLTEMLNPKEKPQTSPLTTPLPFPTDAPAPTSDLQSNAESRTEDEPRSKKKR